MIKIRGQEVQSKDKVTIERKFSEEHDTGKVTVVNNIERRYEMYSTVDYTNGAVSEQLLVESDSVVQLNATDYEHTITLLENKAKFDGIYPADRSFTKLGQTIGDILAVYKRELGEYHNIVIDWNLTATQLNNVVPFKEFAGMNFTTILVSLFRKINAVPYVYRDNSIWEIKARPYNERGAMISSDSITKSYSQTSLDYATKVKTQLKNATNERAQVDVEWYPSENGYVLPKSSKPIKSESDLEYKTPSPIVKMLEVIAVDTTFEYQTAESTTENPIFITVTNADVDITSQVVTEEEYDVLNNTSSVDPVVIRESNNMKNNIKYKQFSREVTALYESSSDKRWFIGFDTPYLKNAIKRAIHNILPTGYKSLSLQSDTTAEPSTFDIKLRFKYVNQRNMDIVSNRKTKGDMNTTTTIHNQRDSSVEVSQYKKAMKNYSNRLGNSEYTKSKNFAIGSGHSIGDFLADGKVVTVVRNTYHPTFVSCEWIEVENFANLEAEYAISKDPSPFSINNKTVQTNIVAEEFVWFSEQKAGRDTRLTDFAQRGLLGLFESGVVPNFNKIHSAVFKPVLPTWDSTKAISMELSNDGDANLITFHSYFDHQLLAANTYYDFDTSSIVDYFQPLKYTDDNGELEDFQIYFVPDILVTDSGEHPLITDEVDYINNAHTLNNIDEPLDLDINAAFAFTYNISFVADKDIFVGEFLARNNYLISDQQDVFNLEIYKSTKPYTLYDQEPHDTDTLANMTFSYDFTNRKITFYALETVEHFCLTQNGNILLAINRDMVSGDDLVININILKRLLDNTYVANSTGSMTISATIDVAKQEFFYGDSTGTMDISETNTVIKAENAVENITGSMVITGVLDVTQQTFFIDTTTGSMSISGDLTVIKTEDTNNTVDVIGSIDMSATLDIITESFVDVDVIGSMTLTADTIGVRNEFTDFADTTSGSITLTGSSTGILDEFTDFDDVTAGSMTLTGTSGGVQNEAYHVWDYIGTSGTEDGTVDIGTSGTSTCRTSTATKTVLASSFPPDNYVQGFIMKVEHSYEDPQFGNVPCTPYYYRIVEVLE